MTLNAPSFPVIRKPELDAFLATALAPELRDQQFLDDLTLEVVTLRGVKLGTLFMQGIEMALLANDACGAPIPLQMCLPWNFFDGKLFHATLIRAAKSRNLIDLSNAICFNVVPALVLVSNSFSRSELTNILIGSSLAPRSICAAALC